MKPRTLNHRAQVWMLAAVAVLLCLGGLAFAFCTSGVGPWDLSDLPLPVYLNNNLDDLICANSDCSNFDQIRRSTLVTLDEFYDNSGSKLRLYYAGTTDADVGAIIDKAIHVFAATGCNDAPAVAAWGDTTGDGKTDFGKVRMCADFIGLPVSWNSYPDTSSTWNLSWQGVMAQEVGHTLGFDHPAVCLQDLKSIMGTTTSTSHHGHHLYKDDIDAYQFHYGFRVDKDVNFKQSATGINWSDVASTPSDMRLALSRLAASNTSSSPATFVSFPNDVIPRIVEVWRYDAGGWTHLSNPPFAATNYHTGTACQDALNVAVAWLAGYNNTTGKQSVILSTTPNAGTTWSTKFIASGSNRTRNAGVSAAYDPESGHYIVVWRDDIGRITSKVDAAGAPIRNYLTEPGSNTYLRASDSVSIACGPANVVGPENCIVAWSDIGWNRTLRWAHGHVDTSGGTPELVLDQVRGQGYIIYGMPSVSFWSNGDFPWELVFHQGGWTAYTLRKHASISATWQDERSFSAGKKIVNPVTGSRTGPQVAGDDVVVQWVYAFFTSSSSP